MVSRFFTSTIWPSPRSSERGPVEALTSGLGRERYAGTSSPRSSERGPVEATPARVGDFSPRRPRLISALNPERGPVEAPSWRALRRQRHVSPRSIERGPVEASSRPTNCKLRRLESPIRAQSERGPVEAQPRRSLPVSTRRFVSPRSIERGPVEASRAPRLPFALDSPRSIRARPR